MGMVSDRKGGGGSMKVSFEKSARGFDRRASMAGGMVINIEAIVDSKLSPMFHSGKEFMIMGDML